MVNYFTNLLKDPRPQHKYTINKITTNIHKLFTKEHNIALIIPISEIEVNESLHQMANGKSLGFDGFPITFFKQCWYFLHKDILEIIRDSRTSRCILPTFNATFLALIPKKDNVAYPSKYYPIEFCNGIYKIIMKFISSRLKPIILFLITREKSDYVEER